MPTRVHDRTTRRPAPMPPAPRPPQRSASEPARTEPTSADAAPNEVVVRVVGDGASRRGPRAHERSGFTIRGFLLSMLVGAVAVGLFLVAGALTGLFHLGNPFATTRVDRTPPAVLQQLSNLSEYHAAQATFLVRVDVEDDVDVLPSFLAGERTLFNATGTVDAIIDFSGLAGDAVRVRGDRVRIVLPEPELARPVVDPTRSAVVDRDRGLVNRIADAFGDDTNNEKDLYVLAGAKLTAAAQESDLRARAEERTQRMLERLLGRLGYRTVEVTFEQPVQPER